VYPAAPLGTNADVMLMLFLTAMVSPIALLLLLLAMERVEQPLRAYEMGAELEDFLDAPPSSAVLPDQVESMVQEGYGPALQRYWRRRRVLALIRREG
jgi:hypothetical protein